VIGDGSPVPHWLLALGEAAAKMDVPPPLVPPGGGRRAAVLVLFADGPEGPDLLLIRRSTGMRLHPGEAAFPGGMIDATDGGPVDAALRETAEEVGVDRGDVDVVTSMPELFIPPTRFLVVPVLAWWRRPRQVTPLILDEVEAVDRISINEFSNPANRFMLHRPAGIVLPAFRLGDRLVWGMTASVVDRLVALAGWERPWDTRIVGLPLLGGEG
jgi:8-oxo-dGTP pyrophosphatase MutT (NUDIX family)